MYLLQPLKSKRFLLAYKIKQRVDIKRIYEKIGLLPRIIIAIILGVVIGSTTPEWTVRMLATFNGISGNFLGFAIPLIIIEFIAPGIGEIA